MKMIYGLCYITSFVPSFYNDLTEDFVCGVMLGYHKIRSHVVLSILKWLYSLVL